MFTTLSSAARRTGLRAGSALGLLVMLAALSSCADTGRTVEDQQQEPTTQVELDADQSRQSEPRDCNPGNRERARAGHGQRDANDRRESHRGARKSTWDEADENENEQGEDEG